MSTDPINPYVGLRPFEVSESLLFFGRNEQTLELLQRLHHHHFVAVVGSSGCGKSSLLRAGLIPALNAGYLVNDSDQWFIAILKPGTSPLENLAKEILLQINPGTYSGSVTAFVEEIKEKGADAIVDLLAPLRKDKNINFFLLVDQFEELFRFNLENTNVVQKADEAIDFVAIMLELAHHPDLPFYVVITMRSDFIGDCSRFFGLPEAMNQSQYLVPRLNRVQMKTVIEGPAKLSGLKVDPVLTSRLLNELGKVQDELPLLQHTLMRIWDFEMSGNKNLVLDLEDYQKTGGIEKALSRHADEALNEMTDEEKKITKILFQALTKIDENGRKIRRPVALDKLVQLTGAGEAALLSIINSFIKGGRSFLVISKTGDTGETTIDISHESLIRQWDTLSKWVDEEDESASRYKQLAEAARLNAKPIPEKSLLSGLELQIILEWYRKFNPREIWATRYKPGYNEAIAYLNNSIAEQTRLLNAEKAKRRKLRSLYWGIMILLVAIAVLSGIGLWFFARQNSKIKAEKHRAEHALQIAEFKTVEADSAKSRANEKARSEAKSAERARMFQQVANTEKEKAFIAEASALKAANDAYYAKIDAISNKNKAIEETRRADSAARFAEEQKAITGRQKEAFVLHAVSLEMVDNDPTIALRIEEKAMKKLQDSIFEQAANKIYYENSFYRIIGTHKNGIISMVSSPDGKTILTGSADNTARLWDLQGNVIHEYTGHTGFVYAVAFSPNGKTMLTGSEDGTARLWNLNGQTLQTFSGHQEGIKAVAFSPDGTKVLTGSKDKTACLWDINGKLLKVFKGHGGTVNAVAFSPDGKTILTGSDDQTAFLWNLKGRVIRKFKGHWAAVTTAIFSPDGKTLITGSEDNTARIWNLKGQGLHRLWHKGYVVSVAVSSDGSKILTGSWDKTASLWDLKGNKLQTFTGNTLKVSSVAFTDSGRKILTGSWDKTLRIWDLSLKLQQEIASHSGIVTSVAFSPDKPMFLSGSVDMTARLWNFDGTLVKEFTNHLNRVTAVAFSPDGKSMATGSLDKIIRIWSLPDYNLKEFKGHSGGVTSVAFSPDSKFLLTGSDDSTARLWDVKKDTLKIFRGHKGKVTSVAFSPDGKTFLTGSEDKTARLWEIYGGLKYEFRGHTERVTCVAFSSDRKSMVTGSADNTAQIWAVNGNRLAEIKGHTLDITSVAFSPDGKTILTVSQDGFARLWDMNGKPIRILFREPWLLTSVAFSPDGSKFLTGSSNKTIRLCDIDAMLLQDFLNSGSIEPLSEEQIKKYQIKN